MQITDTEKLNCPVCGKQSLHTDVRSVAFRYKGHSITIAQSGFRCDSCRESVLEGKNLAKMRLAIQTFRSKIDGLMLPEEIQHVRKKILGLTQQEASALFGGGPNAFSRYERGAVPPPRALSNLLKILAKHPEQINELNVNRMQKA